MLISFLYLLIRLLVIAAVYFGVKWLCDYLGVAVSATLWKIFAAICVILAIIAIVAWGLGLAPGVGAVTGL